MDRFSFNNFKIWRSGFSIAEILICLLLMGILSALTIPLMLNGMGEQPSKYRAMAKNTALMVLIAYERYKSFNDPIPTSARIADLTPYMNYVREDSTTTIDSTNGGSYICGNGGSQRCLVLHNGGYLYYNPIATFNGNNTTNGLWFGLDADGKRNNEPSQGFILTYTGRIIAYGYIDNTYYYHNGAVPSILSPPATSAPWFNDF